MTHEELIELVSKGTMEQDNRDFSIKVAVDSAKALLTVVRLHQPNQYGHCLGCPTHGDVGCYLDNDWKYCPTIQIIQEALV